MDWLSWRYSPVRRFTEAPPLVLVRHGRINGRNLRREHITVPELMAGLREHGIDKLVDVKVMRMEADGGVTVIRHEPDEDGRREPRAGLP